MLGLTTPTSLPSFMPVFQARNQETASPMSYSVTLAPLASFRSPLPRRRRTMATFSTPLFPLTTSPRITLLKAFTSTTDILTPIRLSLCMNSALGFRTPLSSSQTSRQLSELMSALKSFPTLELRSSKAATLSYGTLLLWSRRLSRTLAK